MPTLFITGANRGIGLGIVERTLAKGWQVHATCRAPASAKKLEDLAGRHSGQLTLHQLELLDFAAITRLGAAFKDRSIDVLLNNAGVMNMAQRRFDPADRFQDFGQTDVEDWTKVFQVNVVAPMKIAEALIDSVARSERKVIITTTSIMGSVELITSGRWHHYRTAKAAVNQMMRGMAAELRPRGITCFALHPGAVRTDMNSAKAPLSVDESTTGIVALLERADLAMSGRYMTWNGEELPW
ncbi:MAG: SDR family oxidoreductase [Alphaproteobacteria bacterium]|nr:SDR family oxidoreductase [Alphaproteobacteria bacterium]